MYFLSYLHTGHDPEYLSSDITFVCVTGKVRILMGLVMDHVVVVTFYNNLFVINPLMKRRSSKIIYPFELIKRFI